MKESLDSIRRAFRRGKVQYSTVGQFQAFYQAVKRDPLRPSKDKRAIKRKVARGRVKSGKYYLKTDFVDSFSFEWRNEVAIYEYLVLDFW